MDTLQSLLAAQAPMLEDLEQALPEEVAFTPVAGPLDGENWVEEAEEATDRKIFAEMVAGL